MFKHARKAAQCGLLFVRAVENYFEGDWDRFDFLKEEIRDQKRTRTRLSGILGPHLSKAILMPVEKSVFVTFPKQADKVVDCMKNSLHSMSYCHFHLNP